MNDSNLVNSFNMFVDSDRFISSDSQTDNVIIPLQNTPITCGSDQSIRISLQQFDMYKNWTYVNAYNNIIRLTQMDTIAGGTAAVQSQAITIPPLNYTNLNDLATAVATQLSTQLSSHLGVSISGIPFTSLNQKTGLSQTSVNPDSTSTLAGTNDNIINFNINFASNLPTLTNPILLQSYIADGDAYQLLGMDRNRSSVGTDLSNSGVIIKYKYNSTTGTTDNRSIFFQFLNPAQLSTDSHIYLRTDLGNQNIQTQSLVALNTDSVNSSVNMVQSRILGKIAIDNDLCFYQAQKDFEFFINVSAKTLTYLRLFLTDERNRPLPLSGYSNTGTTGTTNLGTGSGVNNQNTLGNRSFSCVLKFDIYQNQHTANTLVTPPVNHKGINAKYSSSMATRINTPDNGLGFLSSKNLNNIDNK